MHTHTRTHTKTHIHTHVLAVLVALSFAVARNANKVCVTQQDIRRACQLQVCSVCVVYVCMNARMCACVCARKYSIRADTLRQLFTHTVTLIRSHHTRT